MNHRNNNVYSDYMGYMPRGTNSNDLVIWILGFALVLVLVPFWLIFIGAVYLFSKKGKKMKNPFTFTTTPTSGNAAFDEYRAETMARLEAEHEAFGKYLVDLEMKKDRAEFDDFMKNFGEKVD
jgi:hypothetical protein